jgi:hypothetical protein
MVGVNLPDRLLNPLVERDQSSVLLVGRLVERVEAGDPGVVFVVLIRGVEEDSARRSIAWSTRRFYSTNLGEVLPDDDRSILEVFVLPDCGHCARVSLSQGHQFEPTPTVRLGVAGVLVPQMTRVSA